MATPLLLVNHPTNPCVGPSAKLGLVGEFLAYDIEWN